MQTKKAFFFLTFLTFLVFSSCGPKIELKNVYGTWVKINDKDVDTPEAKEEVSFTNDGKYKVTHYNKDSVDMSFEGTFKLDAETRQIKITNEGYRLKDMTVIKLTETQMSAEVSEEYEGSYTLNYRRQRHDK